MTGCFSFAGSADDLLGHGAGLRPAVACPPSGRTQGSAGNAHARRQVKALPAHRGFRAPCQQDHRGGSTTRSCFQPPPGCWTSITTLQPSSLAVIVASRVAVPMAMARLVSTPSGLSVAVSFRLSKRPSARRWMRITRVGAERDLGLDLVIRSQHVRPASVPVFWRNHEESLK